jgi:hypothetical protein
LFVAAQAHVSQPESRLQQMSLIGGNVTLFAAMRPCPLQSHLVCGNSNFSVAAQTEIATEESSLLQSQFELQQTR